MGGIGNGPRVITNKNIGAERRCFTINNIQTLFTILGIIAAVGIIVAVILPQLKKQDIDVGIMLDKTKDLLDTINGTLDVIRPFMEESTDMGVFDKIMSAARIGVGNAEQLHKIGELPAEQRKEAAQQYIKDAAGLMGIEITPEVESLIDGAIEAEVLELAQTKLLKRGNENLSVR